MIPTLLEASRAASRTPADPVSRLLDVSTIYHEPAALTHPRGRQIIDRFPGAELIEVESHWRIPGLFGNEGNVERWNQVKRSVLVLGVKKSVAIAANGRENQEAKVSRGGGHNIRYRTGYKGRMVRQFLQLLERRLPYCRVRYAF